MDITWAGAEEKIIRRNEMKGWFRGKRKAERVRGSMGGGGGGHNSLRGL